MSPRTTGFFIALPFIISALTDLLQASKCEVDQEVAGLKTQRVNHVGGLALDKENRRLILGARNQLLAFSYDLNIIMNKTTKPDRQQCHFENGDCSDFNQIILLRKYKRHKAAMLCCGTNANNPKCSWRKLSNLEKVEEFSAMDMIPGNPNVPAIAAFDSRERSLFTAVVAQSGVSYPALVKLSPLGAKQTTFPKDSVLKSPTFVSAFAVEDWMYFIFKEPAIETKDQLIYSRVARVCLNDDPSALFPKKFQSFVKARITCDVPGDSRNNPHRYDQIVAVVNYEVTLDPQLGPEKRMLAIFSSPGNGPLGSAMCVYSYQSGVPERTSMMTVFDGPYLYQDDQGGRSQSMWEKKDSKMHFQCSADRSISDILKLVLMQNVVRQTTERPLILDTIHRFTSLAMDRVKEKDIAFVGTENGYILKFLILKDKATQVDKIFVMPDEVKKLLINSAEGLLYVASNSSVSVIPVQRCQQYESCSSCIGSEDVYCGWCTSGEHANAKGGIDFNAQCLPENQCAMFRKEWRQSLGVSSALQCRPTLLAPEVKMRAFDKIEAGSDVTLTCFAWGNPLPEIDVWKINGNSVNKNKYSSGRGESTLKIYDVDKPDEGLYSCTFKNVAGTGKVTKKLHVFTKATIVESPSNVKVNKGQVAIFDCGFDGDPQPDIRWEFKHPRQAEMSQYRLPTNVVKRGKALIITSSDEKSAGYYRCVVVNDLGGEKSKWAELSVMYPPSLQSEGATYQNSSVRESVKLHCAVAGNPRPTVTWFHNGRQIQTEKDSTSETNTDTGLDDDILGNHGSGDALVPTISSSDRYVLKANGNLKIRHASLEDTGIWECRGENQAGMAVLNTLTLLVKEKVRNFPSFQLKPIDLSVTEGDKAEFQCKVVGMTEPVLYEWFQRDKDTKPFSLIREEDGPRFYISRRNTLVIPQVEVRHSGEYRCRVSNKQRLLEHGSTLTVAKRVNIVLPSPPPGGSSGSVAMPGDEPTDKSASVMCAIVHKEKSQAARFASATFNFPAKALDRDLNFYCAATNGHVKTQLKLATLPFVIESPPVSVLVFSTSSISIFCEVQCSRKDRYKVMWTVNGTMIDPTRDPRFTITPKENCRSRLTIEVGKIASGEFLCWVRARSGKGSISSQKSTILVSTIYLTDPSLQYLVAQGDNVTFSCPLPVVKGQKVNWTYFRSNKSAIDQPLDCKNPRYRCSEVLQIDRVERRDINIFKFVCKYFNSRRKGYIYVMPAKSRHIDDSRYVKSQGWNWGWSVVRQK
eukprot:m.16670 g.16670  ORF g.16670 m.16670 type:complete len:1256 (+) comp27061_c0_seq3:157-3924(+)